MEKRRDDVSFNVRRRGISVCLSGRTGRTGRFAASVILGNMTSQGLDPDSDFHRSGLRYHGAYGYSFVWRNDYRHADGFCGAGVVLLG